MHVLLTALLSIALLVDTAAATEALSRDQALQALSHADAQVRRDAAVRLGDVGTMADAELLVKALRDPDARTREVAEQSMWRIWARSGDAQVDELYDAAIRQMNAGELRESIASFTRIIEMKPEFAEAWNKRATLYYFTGELRKSLADCDEVMKRNPYHFGALSGYALIYVRLENYDRALEYARRALDINPNLQQVRANIELIERAIGERRNRTI